MSSIIDQTQEKFIPLSMSQIKIVKEILWTTVPIWDGLSYFKATRFKLNYVDTLPPF